MPILLHCAWRQSLRTGMLNPAACCSPFCTWQEEDSVNLPSGVLINRLLDRLNHLAMSVSERQARGKAAKIQEGIDEMETIQKVRELDARIQSILHEQEVRASTEPDENHVLLQIEEMKNHRSEDLRSTDTDAPTE